MARLDFQLPLYYETHSWRAIARTSQLHLIDSYQFPGSI
jgi:hypothetical protein